jgi:hypothetical protein
MGVDTAMVKHLLATAVELKPHGRLPRRRGRRGCVSS